MTDLFTLPELASYLQRDLDTATATLAQQGAQEIVRAYTRQELTQGTYTAAVLPIVAAGDSWRVDLPQRPVTAVTTVVVNGTTYTLGTDWAWNGYSPWIRLARLVYATDAFQDAPTATVTYVAGYATAPPDVKAVALAIAARQYDNPRGLRMESIDDYSGTRAGSDDDLAGVSLLLPEKAILDRYRIRTGSLVPR